MGLTGLMAPVVEAEAEGEEQEEEEQEQEEQEEEQEEEEVRRLPRLLWSRLSSRRRWKRQQQT